MFVRSLGQTFHGPAMQASTTLLVPENHYSRVAGINQAQADAMNIIAPRLALCSLAQCNCTGYSARTSLPSCWQSCRCFLFISHSRKIHPKRWMVNRWYLRYCRISKAVLYIFIVGRGYFMSSSSHLSLTYSLARPFRYCRCWLPSTSMVLQSIMGIWNQPWVSGLFLAGWVLYLGRF